MSDIDIMNLHVNALFTYNEEGRLVRVNEHDGGEAPRFFLGRTASGNTWRFNHEVPQSLCDRLTGVCREEPPLDDSSERPVYVDEYLQILQTSAFGAKISMGPAYDFPRDSARGSSEVVAVTEKNRDILLGGLDYWIPDIERDGPFMAVVKEGRAVAVCCSVRITPKAHEAGVETQIGYRGHGYAADAVRTWAAAVRDIGCMPLYSTSWENTASRAVAKKLGLRQYGVDFHIC